MAKVNINLRESPLSEEFITQARLFMHFHLTKSSTALNRIINIDILAGNFKTNLAFLTYFIFLQIQLISVDLTRMRCCSQTAKTFNHNREQES